jgi:hypothetical protein
MNANRQTIRRQIYVAGEPVEFWEHPDLTFGWTSDDLERYALDGDWVLLFNAMMLNVAALRPDLGAVAA